MLSAFCIRRPIFATVLSILIIVAGLVAVRTLPLSQYPNISPPSVTVSTSWEGANAQTLARTVATPIENQLSGIQGLLYYTTSIRASGDVRIQCTFDVDVDPNDAMLEINNRVRTAERRLPEKVRQNGVTVRKRNNDSLLALVLTSPDGSMLPTDLADYALLNIVDALKRLPGIGDVNVYGNVETAMRLWLDPRRMAKMGVTTSDVEKAVNDKNAERGAGRVGTQPAPDDTQLFYTSLTPGQLLTPEQFDALILRTGKDGEIVRLKDVGRAEVGKRSYEFVNMFQGKPSVTIAVCLQTGANAVAAADAVKTELDRLSTHYPPGRIEHHITDDTTIFVKASLREVFKTLLEAILLVLVVVYLFLQSWRATLIPMLAVPVSLIGTMAGLWAFSFSLNTLTLFAMTLAIGIVVDDAIVVIENVERLMTAEKLSPYKAAQTAMKEVSGALVAIVLVLSAVFVPVAFLGGIADELYRQFAVTIAVSVTLSGFVALTLTPALCAILMKPRAREPFILFRWFNAALAWLTSGYLAVVRLALKARWLTMAVLAAVTFGCYHLFTTTPTSFVPLEDQGILRMTTDLPEGASFPRTFRETEKLRKQIEQRLEGINNMLVMTGFDTTGNDQRPSTATFVIKLDHWDDRAKTAMQLRRELQAIADESPDSRSTASMPPAIRGLGSANGFAGYVQSRGSDDTLQLQEVTERFIEALRERPELTSLRFFLRARSPVIRVELDQEKAAMLGIASSEAYSSLMSLFSGSYINDFTRNGRIYRVIMQAEGEYRTSPEDFGKVHVRSSTTGEMIPLGSVISIKRQAGADSLTRMNGFLAAQFMGSAVLGVSSGDAIRIVEETAEEVLPEGYTIEWIGQAWHEKRISSSSFTAIAFGMLIVFLILAAQFERWSLPVAVVMAIPYALLGALGSLWLRGTSNDIYFQIGLLVLIGLSAKNAILIVEFATQKLEEGMSVFDAALEAARLRLRPILMTSLAFVLGVMPLVFATGAGASARHAMGTGVFGGMLASTFIATIFVPVFFTLCVSKNARGRNRDEE